VSEALARAKNGFADFSGKQDSPMVAGAYNFSCESTWGAWSMKERKMSLQGKIAVVTGASRGIGRAIAIRLAKEGALVVVNYRTSAEAAAAVVEEIETAGGEAFAVPGDVSSVPGIREFFQRVDAELTDRRGSNEFDILINNAGVLLMGNVASSSERDFDRIFAVDVKGPFFVTQAAIPRLRDGGRIINISSAATQHPSPRYAAYSMAKAAVNALSVALAVELGPRGITVNALAPGMTATEMTDALLQQPEAVQSIRSQTALGRIGAAEDIAAVAAFLASPGAGWVTGQYLEASGGLRLV
jgi:3-oxoacyl-[acyl-carrier protein] reductase